MRTGVNRSPLRTLESAWEASVAPKRMMPSAADDLQARLLNSWLLFFIFLIWLLHIFRAVSRVVAPGEVASRIFLTVVIFCAYMLGRRGHVVLSARIAVLASTLIIFFLAADGGAAADSLQILNYLVVTILFASLFLPPWNIWIIFIAHCGFFLLSLRFFSEIDLSQLVNGPVSFNLTITFVLYLITKQRQDLEIRRRAQISRDRDLFQAVLTAVTELPNLIEMADCIVRDLRSNLNFDFARLRIADPEDFFPILNQSYPPHEGDPFPPIGATVFAENINDSTLPPGEKRRLRKVGMTCVVSVPLERADGSKYGAIQFSSAQKRLHANDISFYQTLAQLIGIALQYKRAEDVIRHREAEIRRLTRHSPAVICVATPQSEEIEFINRTTFGGHPVTKINTITHFADLLHEQDRDKFFEIWSQVSVADKRDEKWVDGRIQYQDQKWEWVEIHFAPLPIGLANLPRKIRLTISSLARQREVYYKQRIESLGLLAGGVAHDFNNLLVAIIGQTTLAQRKIESSSIPVEGNPGAHLQKAMAASEQAARVAKQLLAYSGGGHFEIKPLNLSDLIQENSDLLRLRIPKKIILHMELAESLPFVGGDQRQMEQIIMNLLQNAAEAIGEHRGEIWLRTAVLPQNQDLAQYQPTAAPPLAPGTYAVLEVEDTGGGMIPEMVEQIFEPFYSTKGTGRGLGLAAVLGIIRGHKGGISVRSVPGQGSCVTCIFPSVPAPAPMVSAPTPAGRRKEAGRKLLVIDDEWGVREAVADIMSLEGIEVLKAAGGEEGVEIYKEQGAHIDLVLLDLSMPGMNGYDTLLALQTIDSKVRVILSSGYDEAEAMRRLKGEKLVGFLQKPYALDKLVRTIKQNFAAR